MIALRRAAEADYLTLHRMQVTCFLPLLEKYHDDAISPAAEQPERMLARLREPITDYYFIVHDGADIGAVRIISRGTVRVIKQLYILPEHQGKGLGQAAIAAVEVRYPDTTRWELDTIAEEAKLCHLYEKMGYLRVGIVMTVHDGMHIVGYAKNA